MIRILIRNIRLSKHLSVRRLSGLSGVSRTYISEIENGRKSPTLETLYKLAKALNVRVKDLFVCDDEQLFFINI